MNTQNHTDIKSDFWLFDYVPKGWQPYLLLARVDRPVGVWLLLLPCLWALVLAGGSLWLMLLFTLGACVMRAAGCVINDLWDRDLDSAVERTAQRPLANGAISVPQALTFLAGLLISGLIILLYMNGLTIALGFLTVPLIIAYPYMKRITWWPQAFLGIVFNMGALMGFSAASGELPWQAWLLYASGILWTLAYDTIYAHQDSDDDAALGLKSTALLFADHSKLYVSAFYGGSWLLAALAVDPYGFLFLLPAAGYIAWMLKSWNPQVQQSSLITFKAAARYGALLLLGFLVHSLIPA